MRHETESTLCSAASIILHFYQEAFGAMEVEGHAKRHAVP